MELPEYIKKCRQITDACGWPEDAKDMALRNTILKSIVRQKDEVVFLVAQSLLTPYCSVRPRMSLVTRVERKDITKSAARAKQVNKVRPVSLGRFKYMVYKYR